MKNLISKLMFKGKKYSPEILIGIGLASGALAILSACKGTLKAKDILDPVRERVEDIRRYVPVEQQEEKIKEAKAGVTKKIIKSYIPTVVFAGFSASCFIGSFHIQKGRELAVATAYTAIKESFDSYRKNVEEKYGEEVDKEMLHKQSEQKKVVGHDKDGNPIYKVEYNKNDDPNDFTYLFDESNINWTPDAKENIFALQMIQKNLNNRLKRRGHVFLYEVYKALGIDPGVIGPNKMRSAHVIGWLYDPDHPNGDNYIDFGIFKDDMGNLKGYEYDLHVNHGEPSIWLEFNPDGDILTGQNGRRVFTETTRGL